MNGRTPLSWAARYGREAAVQLLILNGANIEAADARGYTPLQRAAICQHGGEVIGLLVGNGAYTEAVDMTGRTSLF
ncbi:hypothetical protein LMH87_002705 [Akanthomyces muscarius]|uniref:Ankyrin repeat protein n=1 Tax=Akanthomyces muscarius TaxID=2231603 RepID=A0A9W8UIT8_AKAMU|nr:hypothetical protein LMH87_002705 [Akanthomyces muscarius]KAJ4148225.1 hypothetical protein LMH87_002705 [Akanthomyces muscarius]